MIKAVETILLQDITAIKNALVESDYGPGLIKDHKDTKARSYENQRAITRFKTIVYSISTALTFLVIGVSVAANWIKIFG